jgi:hypothetical protein
MFDISQFGIAKQYLDGARLWPQIQTAQYREHHWYDVSTNEFNLLVRFANRFNDRFTDSKGLPVKVFDIYLAKDGNKSYLNSALEKSLSDTDIEDHLFIEVLNHFGDLSPLCYSIFGMLLSPEDQVHLYLPRHVYDMRNLKAKKLKASWEEILINLNAVFALKELDDQIINEVSQTKFGDSIELFLDWTERFQGKLSAFPTGSWVTRCFEYRFVHVDETDGYKAKVYDYDVVKGRLQWRPEIPGGYYPAEEWNHWFHDSSWI